MQHTIWYESYFRKIAHNSTVKRMLNDVLYDQFMNDTSNDFIILGCRYMRIVHSKWISFYEILVKSLKAWDVSGTGQSNTQDLENARSSIPMLNRLEMLVSNVLSPWISTGNFWFRKLQLDGKPHFLWFLVTISLIQILDGTVSYLVWQCTIQVHQRNLSILWTLFRYHQKLCLCSLLCRLDDFTRKSFRLIF